MNYKLNQENYETLQIDKNVDKEKYLLYRKLFTEYIIEKLNLKKYDEEIEQSKLNFIPVEEKDMDIYQYFSCDVLKYFYIRNNLYIEKLDEHSIELLDKKIKNKYYELDESARNIIEKTYKDILFKDEIEGFKNYVFYGPNTTSFSAENKAVVIGVRYDEFNLNNMSDKEWGNNYEQQQLWLQLMLAKLNVKSEEILQNSVAIIKYNEYSIIRRNQNQEKQRKGGKDMKKIPEKFLPIGTVVMLKEGTKRVMIAGFCAVENGENEEENAERKIWDYSGCLYPEGFLQSNQTCLFDHDQIEEIYHLGLGADEDDEEKEFKQQLNKVIEETENFQNIDNSEENEDKE